MKTVVASLRRSIPIFSIALALAFGSSISSANTATSLEPNDTDWVRVIELTEMPANELAPYPTPPWKKKVTASNVSATEKAANDAARSLCTRQMTGYRNTCVTARGKFSAKGCAKASCAKTVNGRWQCVADGTATCLRIQADEDFSLDDWSLWVEESNS